MVPTTTGESLIRLWESLRIMPIRSEAVAPQLCRQGRVSALSGHAAFQPIPSCRFLGMTTFWRFRKPQSTALYS